MYIHLSFFFVGIFQDLLITYYYQVIMKEYPWRSALLSMIVTLVNIFVLYSILSGLEEQVLSVVLAYTLGNGVGTYLVVKKHAIKRLFLRK